MSKEIKVRVEAGDHNRVHVPLTFVIKSEEIGSFDSAVLIDIATDNEVPIQWITEGDVVKFYWILDWLQRGGVREYELRLGEESKLRGFEITVDDEKKKLNITFNNKHILTHNFGGEWSKPHIYPLRGPFGLLITENEPPDHKHHKSLWVAHGAVNGVDVWSEAKGHGRIVHKDFLRINNGSVFAEFIELNTWVNANGEPLLDEQRTIRVWAVRDEEYFIDFNVKLLASYTDVLLADTKEAGILSVRVARSMTVKNSGMIMNSWGGINERETWGRRAEWCDYSGEVNGIWVGITIFDNPLNPRFPTYWHVRNYGLMTANVFGLSLFEKGRGLKGDMLIRKGESRYFNYRIYIHKGNAIDARVGSRYIDYIYPPKIHKL